MYNLRRSEKRVDGHEGIRKDKLNAGEIRKNAFKVYHYNPYEMGSLTAAGGGLKDSRMCTNGTVHMKVDIEKL